MVFLFSFYSLGACLCGFRGLIVERGGVGEQKFPDSLVAVFHFSYYQFLGVHFLVSFFLVQTYFTFSLAIFLLGHWYA